jgi:hypothetical protein
LLAAAGFPGAFGPAALGRGSASDKVTIALNEINFYRDAMHHASPPEVLTWLQAKCFPESGGREAEIAAMARELLKDTLHLLTDGA